MKNISIHVPAWGTTRCLRRAVVIGVISIHVPAWGTTMVVLFGWNLKPKFQSTFPRGERPERLSAFMTKRIFQSTFPRGERHAGLHSLCSADNFNPRSRVGNDFPASNNRKRNCISIHVPAWGTTQLLW